MKWRWPWSGRSFICAAREPRSHHPRLRPVPCRALLQRARGLYAMGRDRLVPVRPHARPDDARLGGARLVHPPRANHAAGGRSRRSRRSAHAALRRAPDPGARRRFASGTGGGAHHGHLAVLWRAAPVRYDAALAGPASKSLAPLLVRREQFAQSVAWSTSAQQTGIITGPAAGGLLYLLGAPVTFSVCLVLALVAAFVMLAIRTRVVASKADGTSALSRAMAGLRYLLMQPIVFGAITLDLFAVLVGGVNALLPVFARDILRVGPAGLGAMRSTFAVGAIATSMLLAQLPEERQPHAGRALFGGVAAFGLGAVIFAMAGKYWLALAALFVMGAGDAMSVFVRATVAQLATPEDMRGRVSAIHVLFVGCTNELGEFRAGLLASLFGAVPAALAGGFGTLVIVALWTQLFPGLRRV